MTTRAFPQVTAPVLRAGIYYRVSSDEQVDGFSLDAQRRLLLDFCQAKGWTIVDEYADEGKSARGDSIEKRPAFKRLLDDAEAGRLDVVVVHKIDRFARNIRVTFESLERLARHQVAFVATAQPDLDYTRPEGRLFMGMMATLAQYYSDNLSQETKKGKAERKAQGYHNGRIPWGLMKGPDGIPVANPATIDGLQLAFALAAEGRTDRQIAQALNAAGYRTAGYRTGKPELFTKDTICAMLQNRFYLGELPGERPADAAPVRHQAVIDPAIFAAVQEARERRAATRSGSVPRALTTYSLSGLATCGHCGGRLQIQRSQQGVRLYCAKRRQGLACDSRSVVLADCEQQLAAYLASFTIPADYRARLRAYVASEANPTDDPAGQRQRIETRLERLRELYSWGDLERADYLAQRDLLLRDLAALDARESDDDAHLDRLAELLGNIARLWHEAEPAQRNEIARLLFDDVVIEYQQVAAVKPRPELAGFFALDCQVRGESCKGAEVTGNDSASPTREKPLIACGVRFHSLGGVRCVTGGRRVNGVDVVRSTKQKSRRTSGRWWLRRRECWASGRLPVALG